MGDGDADKRAEMPEGSRGEGGGTTRPAEATRQAPATCQDQARDGVQLLMEEVLRRGNVHKAYLRVVRNGGAPGVDGMTVGDLMAYCRDHWTRIREELLNRSYVPQPARKVEIPKPGGKGTRMLGIPTVCMLEPCGARTYPFQRSLRLGLHARWDTVVSFRANTDKVQAGWVSVRSSSKLSKGCLDQQGCALGRR